MPRVYKCTFCGHKIPPGTGTIFVKNDGSLYRFCSRRCMVSALKFKRDPRKLKWTLKHKKRTRVARSTEFR